MEPLFPKGTTIIVEPNHSSNRIKTSCIPNRKHLSYSYEKSAVVLISGGIELRQPVLLLPHTKRIRLLWSHIQLWAAPSSRTRREKTRSSFFN